MNVAQGKIHLSRSIGEDPVTEDPLREALRLRFGIATLDANQREDAFADRGNVFATDGDLRPGDALNQTDQAMMLGMRRARSFWIWSLRTSLRFFRRRSCS